MPLLFVLGFGCDAHRGLEPVYSDAGLGHKIETGAPSEADAEAGFGEASTDAEGDSNAEADGNTDAASIPDSDATDAEEPLDAPTTDSHTHDAPTADSNTHDAAWQDGGATYGANVRPILSAKCAPCHTTLGSGGSNLAATYADTQLPSYACPGLTKGACALVRVQNGSMPVGKGCSGDPASDVANASCLTALEQAVLQNWIAGGQLP